MNNQFEFESKEFENYMERIRSESKQIIEKIILEYSPIKIGDDIETISFGRKTVLRVSTIELCAIDQWGYPGDKLSFNYYGLLLSKSGKPMKNRKPVWFSSFIKNKKRYDMPSYNRVNIKKAKMQD